MKILAPVDSAVEASRLAELGARELYGGFLTPEWRELFALDASPNRRSFPEAQIRDAEELRRVIRAAHAGGSRFYLTVNSPYYAAAQYGPLLRLAAEALEAGTDAFIAADIGFILEAREHWPGVPIHLSTLGDVANHAAAAFWRRVGVARITLARHLPLSEIRAIVAGSPGVRFDGFLLYGQCPNAEGHCTFSHDHPRRLWPCVQAYRITPREETETAARAAAAQAGWAGRNRAEACGLCALWDLAQGGLEAVKIVGRGLPAERKEWAVRTVNDLLRRIDAGLGREEFLALARERSRDRFSHGCSPYLCYFPEMIP